ncbi:MAG TPA: hypothetical protein VI299_02985 [Polyangiales bacterium]
MDQLVSEDRLTPPERRDADSGSARRVTSYLRERASPYAARVSDWWLHVKSREGCEPMSYYDQ